MTTTTTASTASASASASTTSPRGPSMDVIARTNTMKTMEEEDETTTVHSGIEVVKLVDHPSVPKGLIMDPHNVPQGFVWDATHQVLMLDHSLSYHIVMPLYERAISMLQELERVLLFTDVLDPEERQRRRLAAQKGLHAVHDLERLLPPGQTYSKAVVDPSTSNNSLTALLDALKTHFETALTTSQKAVTATCQEAERQWLFTDLDELRMRDEQVTPDIDIVHEMQLVVRELEDTVQQCTATTQETYEQIETLLHDYATSTTMVTTKVVEECQRQFLFTDLDDNHRLINGKTRSKRDVMRHFVGKQKVLQELTSNNKATSKKTRNQKKKIRFIQTNPTF